MLRILSFILSFTTGVYAMAAQAQEVVGIAKPWQLGFQDPATPVMEELVHLHDNLLLAIITVITLFVIVLTAYIMLRFRRREGIAPSKTSHNTLVEVIWTVVPILILVAIAVPSLRTHYFMKRAPEADMTLKIVGYQWYWGYEYPDQGGFGFESYMIKDEDLKPGQPRLLAVDNHVVVPVNKVVRVQVTGADVIHSWAMPAFGVKRDAVPGRLNETWFKATKTGTFYGQCSEICGVGHGFMPIAVDVVSEAEFNAWVKTRQDEAGIVPATLEIPAEAIEGTAIPTPAEQQENLVPPAPIPNVTQEGTI